MESRVDLPTLRQWKLFIAWEASKNAYNCFENNAEFLMRGHTVNCQIENGKDMKYLQPKINGAAILYAKEIMKEGGFTREEKLRIVDELIRGVKESSCKKFLAKEEDYPCE